MARLPNLVKQVKTKRKELVSKEDGFNVGARLRQLRIEHDYPTADDFAIKLKCTRQYVTNLELNKSSPSVHTLENVIHPLGLNIVQFFSQGIQTKFGNPSNLYIHQMIEEILKDEDDLARCIKMVIRMAHEKKAQDGLG